MTTRSTTQGRPPAAGRFQGAVGDQRENHPLGHLDVQPSPAGSPRRCPAAPTTDPGPCATRPAGGDDLDLTAPGGGRGLLRGHYRQIDATSRASAARSTSSAPEVVDHPWRPSSRSAVCYLVEYAGSSPAQDSQLP